MPWPQEGGPRSGRLEMLHCSDRCRLVVRAMRFSTEMDTFLRLLAQATARALCYPCCVIGPPFCRIGPHPNGMRSWNPPVSRLSLRPWKPAVWTWPTQPISSSKQKVRKTGQKLSSHGCKWLRGGNIQLHECKIG